MIRKTVRIHMVVTKEIGDELKKESKKSQKYITELLMEGWELYKNNKIGNEFKPNPYSL